MRPRRVVVLIDDQEKRRGLRRFMLDVRGFAVADVAPAELPEQKEELRVQWLDGADVVVIDASASAARKLSARCCEASPETRILVITADAAWNDVCADGWIERKSATSGALYETVRKLAQRRRGPKKASVRAATATAAMEAIA